MTNSTSPDIILDRAIRARYPIIAVSSNEETRVTAALKAIADKRSKALFVWTLALGLVPQGDIPSNKFPAPDELRDPNACLSAIYNASENVEGGAIFVMKDTHRLFDGDPTVTRWMRDIVAKFQEQLLTLVLVSPNFKIPVDLEKDVFLIDWPLPTTAELEQIVDACIKSLPKGVTSKLTNGDLEKLVRALAGLTDFEARSVLSMAIVTYKVVDERAIKLVLEEKKAIVKKGGYLEYYDTDVSYNDIGGAAKLKDYLRKKRSAFTAKAEAFGVPQPRGILTVGVPGAGKSLLAKAATGGQMPLLRLDIGSLMGGLVGQSEGNARAALKLAEAVSPCILWIDEIEKGMSGMGGGGDNDGGTSRRVFGTILTWMQEHTSPVYVFATANDIRGMAEKSPELLRRFDDIWWVDLPTNAERAEIAAIHIAKRKRDASKFDLAAIANATANMTGAEIEKVVAAAVVNAFDDGERDLRTSDIVASAKEIVPVAVTMGDGLTQLRAWAKTRARWASDEELPLTKQVGRGLELD